MYSIVSVISTVFGNPPVLKHSMLTCLDSKPTVICAGVGNSSQQVDSDGRGSVL